MAHGPARQADGEATRHPHVLRVRHFDFVVKCYDPPVGNQVRAQRLDPPARSRLRNVMTKFDALTKAKTAAESAAVALLRALYAANKVENGIRIAGMKPCDIELEIAEQLRP